MTSLNIQEIEPRQWLDDIDQVFKAAYKVEAAILSAKIFPPLQRPKANLAECGNRFIGAMKHDNLLGAVELEKNELDESTITIASLAIDPKHFRQGLARQLMKFVLDEHQSMRFRVTTAALNKPAIRLYSEFGFVIIERFKTSDKIDMVELRSS